MPVSALDSRVFRNLFGTQKIRDLFSDEAYVKHMINVEAALARAQSKKGVIPPTRRQFNNGSFQRHDD